MNNWLLTTLDQIVVKEWTLNWLIWNLQSLIGSIWDIIFISFILINLIVRIFFLTLEVLPVTVGLLKLNWQHFKTLTLKHSINYIKIKSCDIGLNFRYLWCNRTIFIRLNSYFLIYSKSKYLIKKKIISLKLFRLF